LAVGVALLAVRFLAGDAALSPEGVAFLAGVFAPFAALLGGPGGRLASGGVTAAS
jgi:hypothetical protein